MDIMGVRRLMGYQLDDARTRNRVYRLFLGLNVNQSEMHGIYGIECGTGHSDK